MLSVVAASIKLPKVACDLFFVPEKRVPAEIDVPNNVQQVIDQHFSTTLPAKS
jgi:hypothetical protein